MAGKREYCHGCRDDFYNGGNNEIGVKECWSLKDAEVVTRYKLEWWTPPTSAAAFRKVTTNSCWYAPGKYAMCKELPEHCRTKPATFSEAAPQ